MNKGSFHFYYLLIIGILLIYSVFISLRFYIDDTYSFSFFMPNIGIEKEKEEEIKEELNINYFVDNLKLKDYSGTKFKITEEGKTIINNIRSLHKSATLIGKNNLDKELCAGYIWLLTEKIWGEETPYHIGMMNTETRKPASARELPKFYSGLGGDVLLDFGDMFSINKKDFWDKINKEDIKLFFKTAFMEESLFGDIGFLYKDTKYTSFLNGWSHNSHITKNLGISEFEFIVGKDYKDLSTIGIIGETIGCSNDINAELFEVLQNYNLKVNGKRVFLANNELYYLSDYNTGGDRVILKYLDKISYDDITLSHFYNARSNVNGLFDMVCSGEFFPINIISINSRLIEKM